MATPARMASVGAPLAALARLRHHCAAISQSSVGKGAPALHPSVFLSGAVLRHPPLDVRQACCQTGRAPLVGIPVAGRSHRSHMAAVTGTLSTHRPLRTVTLVRPYIGGTRGGARCRVESCAQIRIAAGSVGIMATGRSVVAGGARLCDGIATSTTIARCVGRSAQDRDMWAFRANSFVAHVLRKRHAQELGRGQFMMTAPA